MEAAFGRSGQEHHFAFPDSKENPHAASAHLGMGSAGPDGTGVAFNGGLATVGLGAHDLAANETHGWNSGFITHGIGA